MCKKNFDYKKELYRGTIKQFMKVRNLRAISIGNYLNWLNVPHTTDVHSVKLDIQDGYINLFNRKGEKIVDAPESLHAYAYNTVMDIFNNENSIPWKVKRNILVKLGR